MIEGRVVWYSPSKGYGVVRADPSPGRRERDVFCHAVALERSGLRTLETKQRVMFEYGKDRGRTIVTNIWLLSDYKQAPIYPHWHKTFAQKVSAAKSIGDKQKQAILATLEAIGREARKRGWTIKYTSQFRGRVSSRYITIPGVGICRVSNHHVANGARTYWNGEVLVTSDNWRTWTLDSFMAAIIEQARR